MQCKEGERERREKEYRETLEEMNDADICCKRKRYLPLLLLISLSPFLPTYLLTYPPTYLFNLPIYLPTYLTTYLLTYQLNYLGIYLPTYLTTYLPTYLFTYLPTNYFTSYYYYNYPICPRSHLLIKQPLASIMVSF